MQKTVEFIKNQIDSLLAARGRVMVAIDGSCTSGKTTLAAELAKEFTWERLGPRDIYLNVDKLEIHKTVVIEDICK